MGITREEREWLFSVGREIQSAMVLEMEKDTFWDDEYLWNRIEETVLCLNQDQYVSMEQKQYLVRSVFNAMRRLDVLQELLEDPEITEIMVNGPDRIFIEKQGKLFLSDFRFESLQKLEDVIQHMVTSVNRIVNESSPIVDARLENGARLNVVLPPVSIDGPAVTIRKFPEEALTMGRLIAMNSLTQEVADFLEIMVQAKYNIMISGGTGSGKTTFLNALSHYIPSDERIITIEDSAELQIPRDKIPNQVRLEVKNASVEGKNAITIRDLVRSALRQRPDRIIIGEVRDGAAVELLQAMNTGHDGSLSTGHANSPMDMVHRLETLSLMGIDIPLQAIRGQIASAVDLIVQLSRLRDKSRRVIEIDEVVGMEAETVVLKPIYVFKEVQDRSEEEKEWEREQLSQTEQLRSQSPGGENQVRGSLHCVCQQLTHQGKLHSAGLCWQGTTSVPL